MTGTGSREDSSLAEPGGERHRSARSGVLAALALAAIWAIYGSPWLIGGKVIPFDAKNHFYPMVIFFAETLRSGQGPAWSPFHYGGFPMLSDPQSVIWTPTFWLPALISARPSMWLVDLVHHLHLLAGSLAIFGWGRLRGWHWAPAMVAAIGYMMAGAVAARMEHLLMIVSYMWLAVALWRLEALLQRGGLWRGIAFGLPLGLMLIDRNHVAYLGAWLLFAYWLSRLIGQLGEVRPAPLLRRHLPLTLGGVLALAMAAVPVLLLLQLAGQSNRPSFAYLDAAWQSLHPAALATIPMAEFFGPMREANMYWGPAGWRWGGEKLFMTRSMLHGYIGALPVFLIAWYGIARGWLLGREARFFTLMAIVALIYALGRYTPVFEFLYETVPGVDLFRRPSDALFIFGFAVALLSGGLLNRALDVGREEGAREEGGHTNALTALIFAVVLSLPIGAALWLALSREHLPVALLAAGKLAGLMLLAGLLIAACRRKPRWRGALAGLIVLLAAADLLSSSLGTRLNARPPDSYRPLEEPGSDPLFTWLEDLLARPDPTGVPWRIETIALGPSVQNIGQAARIHTLLSYNPLRLRGFETYIGPDMQNNAGPRRRFGTRMTGYDSEMTDILGLRFIVSGKPLAEIDPAYPEGRFTLIGEIPRGKRRAFVYRNERAQPRAVLRAHDGTPVAGRVTFSDYGTATRTLLVTAEAPGLVILHEFDYPGWEAFLDGRPVPILRHQDLFQAIAVEPGTSEITMRFNPLSLANLKAAARGLTAGGD